jgi:CRP-like cAMP-binding protein
MMAETRIAGSALRHLFDGTPSVADRQTALARADDSSRRAFLLTSGWAARERVLPDGRRAILDLYLPGDLIGLEDLFLGRVSDGIVAMTVVAYHALERDALRKSLSESPAVALEIMRFAASEKERMHRHATRLTCLSGIERTVAGLHNLYERLSTTGSKVEQNGRPVFRLPLTQQQLADYLGLNIIHLNRTLRALRDGGILKIERGMVFIEDTDRLRTVAGAALDIV